MGYSGELRNREQNMAWRCAERIIEFWKYLSTNSYLDCMEPAFNYYWDTWHEAETGVLPRENLQEDIIGPRNLSSEAFRMFSSLNGHYQTRGSLTLQIHGICTIIHP